MVSIASDEVLAERLLVLEAEAAPQTAAGWDRSLDSFSYETTGRKLPSKVKELGFRLNTVRRPVGFRFRSSVTSHVVFRSITERERQRPTQR
jgi:hypothetical protein